MRVIAISMLVGLFGSGLCALGQGHGEVVADFGRHVRSSVTLDPGTIGLELGGGISLFDRTDSVAQHRSFEIARLGVRLGLGRLDEIGVVGGFRRIIMLDSVDCRNNKGAEQQSIADQVEVTARYRRFSEAYRGLAAGGEIGSTVVAGRTDPTLRIDGRIAFAAITPPEFLVHFFALNLGAAISSDEGWEGTFFSASTDLRLSKVFVGTIEYSSEGEGGGYEGSILRTGLSVNVSDRLQFGLSSFVGLGDPAPSVGVSVGCSWRSMNTSTVHRDTNP